jgi:hypothetical protein
MVAFLGSDSPLYPPQQHKCGRTRSIWRHVRGNQRTFLRLCFCGSNLHSILATPRIRTPTHRTQGHPAGASAVGTGPRRFCRAFEQQVALMSRDSFLHAYQIVYEQLCASCASLLRAHKSVGVWQKMWKLYESGYRDIFPNSLKNVILADRVAFSQCHLSFFRDNGSLVRFCFRFESFMEDAERADPNGGLRTTLESSGLESAYVALCDVLERPLASKYRMSADDARLDRMDEYGMPKVDQRIDFF